MSILDAEAKRRLRGIVLQLVCENHERQGHRLDDITLHGALERLHYDVSRNELKAVLQDLSERGLLSFKEDKNKDTGKVSIRLIQIAPAGRDLVERSKADPAVEFE